MSLNRNAAWFVPGGQFHDPTGRYHTVFTTINTTDRPVAEYCILCIQDAFDPVDPNGPNEQRNWSIAVDAGNWWVRDDHGRRLPGWSPDRYAVDLGLAAPWNWLRTQLHLHAGFRGFHWDDLTLIPELPGVDACVDTASWHAQAAAFMAALPVCCSINGGKDLYVPRVIPCGAIKLEYSREHAPWGDRPGHPMDWNTWTFGRDDFGPGIQGLVGAGKSVVCDVFFGNSWTPQEREAHARAMMVTALLFNAVYVAFHDSARNWWKTPLYYPCCEWWKRLGDPIQAQAAQYPDMTWRRQYANGTVVVNGDGTNGRII